MFGRGLGSHQKLLISDSRRRRPLRDKGQLEVVDDAIDHGEIGEESDDLASPVVLKAVRLSVPPRFGLRLAHTEKARLLKPLWHDKLLKKGTKGVPRALGTFFKE